MKTKLLELLQIAANVSVVVICFAMLIQFAEQYVVHKSAHETTFTQGLTLGSKSIALPGTSYDAHRLTVAIFLSSRCITCRQSIAEYNALGQAVDSRNGMVQIVGVFAKEPPYSISSLGLQLPVVNVESFGPYRISGTPTIMVLDDAGVIQDFWIGKLTVNSKARLYKLIKEAGHA